MDDAIVAKAPSQNGTGTLTMMFRVNGAATYARGGNKIPMELLDGRMTAVAHRRLVQSAAEGNFNMLRICALLRSPLSASRWQAEGCLTPVAAGRRGRCDLRASCVLRCDEWRMAAFRAVSRAAMSM